MNAKDRRKARRAGDPYNTLSRHISRLALKAKREGNTELLNALKSINQPPRGESRV